MPLFSLDSGQYQFRTVLTAGGQHRRRHESRKLRTTISYMGFAAASSPGLPGSTPDSLLALLTSLADGVPGLFWAVNMDLTVNTVAGEVFRRTHARASRYPGQPVDTLFDKAVTRQR